MSCHLSTFSESSVLTRSLDSYLNDQAAYQAQLDRVLSYAHARGMYAVIDMHGLPGSQNGEQTSVRD